MSRKNKYKGISGNYDLAVHKLQVLRGRWVREKVNRPTLEVQGRLQAKIVAMLKRNLDKLYKNDPPPKTSQATYEEAKEIFT